MVAEVYRNFRKNQELMLQEYHWVGSLEYHKIVIHPENGLTIYILDTFQKILIAWRIQI